jgi:hypothetical protein
MPVEAHPQHEADSRLCQISLRVGTSQRTVRRALDSLAAEGRVQAFGRARARRWMTPPVPGFTTTLLLPAPLPSD